MALKEDKFLNLSVQQEGNELWDDSVERERSPRKKLIQQTNYHGPVQVLKKPVPGYSKVASTIAIVLLSWYLRNRRLGRACLLAFCFMHVLNKCLWFMVFLKRHLFRYLRFQRPGSCLLYPLYYNNHSRSYHFFFHVGKVRKVCNCAFPLCTEASAWEQRWARRLQCKLTLRNTERGSPLYSPPAPCLWSTDLPEAWLLVLGYRDIGTSQLFSTVPTGCWFLVEQSGNFQRHSLLWHVKATPGSLQTSPQGPWLV